MLSNSIKLDFCMLGQHQVSVMIYKKLSSILAAHVDAFYLEITKHATMKPYLNDTCSVMSGRSCSIWTDWDKLQ